MKKKPFISISTKTGDAGTSGLINGVRLSKDSPIFEVIGTLDELNSWLGLIATHLDVDHDAHKRFIYKIQDTLFYIGAELAQSPKTKLQTTAVKALEKQATALQESLSDNWHTKFLLPGGTKLGAYCDLARTVCRRSERRLITLMKVQKVSSNNLKYINRLSDYLFLLRCFVNDAAEYRELEFIESH
ncbi:MAG: ATP:cob(I)alamin adenosyltransferase [Candidatus Pacebacteria bacterium CG_4_10_14_0_8_um_filter_42_14]|nr:MAG: ATP:cob(I)alamin adenosyltransferase [Candidatus Pacebacteria bacterium CG_4_10_14_0_8_um_filter_42_14]